MGTRLTKNGKEGVFDLKWGWMERVFAGTATALLVAVIIGLFNLSIQVYLLNWRVAAIEKSIGLGPVPSILTRSPFTVAPPPKT